MQNVRTFSQHLMLTRLFGLIVARFFSPLTSFLLVILIARIWGRESLGQYSTVLAWLAIFQFLARFGSAEYISREVGKNLSEGPKYLVHGLLFGLIASLICMGLMNGAAVLFGYPPEVMNGIMTSSLALPLFMCILTCQAVFVAFQKVQYVAFTTLLESILVLLLGATAITRGYGLVPLIGCFVVAKLLSSALNLFVAHRYIARLHFQFDRAFFWKMLAPIAVFGLTGLAHQVFLRIDIVMLSKMKDMASVGMYIPASKIMEICLILPMAFYILNLPVLAKFYKDSEGSTKQRIETYTRELFVVVFFVFGFVVLLARTIIGIVFGDSYVESEGVLRILMVAFLIQSAEMVLGMSCQAAGYHKQTMHISVFRAMANVGLNLILIPMWGILGAALATLFSVVFSFLVFQFYVARTLHGFRWIRITMKPALVCSFLMVVLYPFVERLNILVLSMMFLLGYGVSLLVLNGFFHLRADSVTPP